MSEYRVPFEDARSEFVEKRSRFISYVWRVESEAEARARIERVKKQDHDARHHCWCYCIREGGVVRYSDDDEPQGTAGQPMLNVFQRQEITDVCCVVTRYFGGILLGAGGLLRAYTRGAKDALDAAGVSAVRPWARVEIPCPYALFERVKLEVEAAGGVLGEAEYGEQVLVRALLPQGAEEAFAARITELTAGGSAVERLGEEFRAVPLR